MWKYFAIELAILGLILYFGFVRVFRNSRTARKVVEETLGDNTPEAALREFELARDRLTAHLESPELPEEMAQEIERALGLNQNA